MPPRVAVVFAAIFNFIGAFLSLKVAATVGKDIVDSDAVTMTVVFAGLIGAIAWNLATWYFGLPSSSSHALIGGLVGAAFAAQGAERDHRRGAARQGDHPGADRAGPRLRRRRRGDHRGLRDRRAPATGAREPRLPARPVALVRGLLALSHGTNDAQKTMGIITLALVAHGNICADHFHVPDWVVVASASAIALGTYTGGWRIIRTMGSRIIKMDPAQGFAAQGAGAAVILAASHAGYPLSTTHVISGGVMGAGAAKRVSAVRWGVAGNIVIAWVLTIPAAATIGAFIYGVTRIFGASSAVGPVVVRW